MDKKRKNETLADKIAGILNTAPVSFDPEEDINEETKAKVTEALEDHQSSDEEILSKLRKQNVDLLEEVDTRYAGKKVSRKNLKESDEESLDDSDENIESDDDSNDEVDSGDDESNDVSDEEESDFDMNEENEKNDSNFKHLENTNISDQVNKGLCIRNQLSTCESLLEIRIQLQKCLLASNKMPQVDKFKELKENDEFRKKAGETEKILKKTLDKMIDLQRLCIKNYPETKNIFGKQKKIEESDEEIPSDTEEETEEEIVDTVPKKRARLDDYESEISTIHNTYKSYRNETIQKWNEKTRLTMGKSAGAHSVINQIEHNLSDRDRLIKRTQLKRSDYTILGDDSEVQEHNSNIFDDDDFYHQLLRELIEVKSAGITDPVQLGRQWIQLQNLRSKMKRKIDTKATKGRKIRYTVHSKLVNFMAPIDENALTNEAKNELFNSLFGKK